MLEIKNLKTQFTTPEGIVHAVDGIDLSIDMGQTLGLVGESACGKSVTALSIMRLLPNSIAKIADGQILFEGKDLARLSEREMEDVRGRQIAMIFQDPMTSLNPTLTIGYQLMETLVRHMDMDQKQAHARSIELLEEVQIPKAAERMKAYPYQFSGGMRQRVMIAMAISCKPKLLIADEPTTALDVTVQAQVLNLLQELRSAYGMSLLLITHDMGVVANHTDKVAIMYAGQILETAPTKQIFSNPEHPYTEMLLSALPDLDDPNPRARRLATIPGRPPDLINLPTNCRFFDRCPHAHLNDCCQTQIPDFREIGEGHWVRSCHPKSERERAHKEENDE